MSPGGQFLVSLDTSICAANRTSGSSPLARGTPLALLVVDLRHRFIPAGAGNTPARAHAPVRRTVHPRWRGEHPCTVTRRPNSCGSSPLARGTRDEEAGAGKRGRFIPAGAGNTFRHPAAERTRTVHPRWRGEHNSRTMAALTSAGSSPLARGTPRRAHRPGLGLRFIPAGAGNTYSRRSGAMGMAVHPRWRGEHLAGHTEGMRMNGSSPLARGTPHRPARGQGGARFIPAGAGNTAR